VEERHTALLIFAAGIMPFIWGWTVHWLLSKLWPQRQASPRKPGGPLNSTPPLDYQI
jgi:hypothetical protein